jgi:hypothetical protein
MPIFSNTPRFQIAFYKYPMRVKNLFQQVHYPAVAVGGSQPDLFPGLFMLLV